MIRDRERLDRCYEEIAGRICALLEAGQIVAFITLGDPTVYSTYIYVHKKVLARGYDAQIIPGTLLLRCGGPAGRLPVRGGGAAAHRPSLPPGGRLSGCKGQQGLHEGREGHRGAPGPAGGAGLLDRASLVANCGMEGEAVYPRFADVEDGTGYFSVVLVKEPEEPAPRAGEKQEG